MKGIWTQIIAVAISVALVGCGVDEAKDAKDSLLGGGPGIDDAESIDFVSDVSWLKDNFGHFDQASIPWVFGTFFFFATVAGESGIPVLFDYDNPPDIKVDLKIQAAGSVLLGNRAPVTVYEGTDVPLKLGQFSAMVTIDEQTTSYEKIPETVPLVGGKTIYPLYFVIPLDQYAWGEAGAEARDSFKNALNAGDLSQSSEAEAGTPVPWYDCETVKITVSYKGTATDGYQVTSEKYLASDPKVTLKLLGQLTDTFGPELASQTGFDLAKLQEALGGIEAPDCEVPDEADIALFN